MQTSITTQIHTASMAFIYLLLVFDAAAATCDVKMSSDYIGDKLKFADVTITYGKGHVGITGLATGDRSTGCPGCVKVAFLQIFNKSSSSFIGVKQYRCDSGYNSGSLRRFEVQYALPRGAVFEGHDFELRGSELWDYCGSFKGNFNPKTGYATQQ